MRRREFIALLGSVLATWPEVALAQTVNRARRIGFLNSSAEEDAEAAKRLAAFKLRLQELGWTEGKNLQIDVRFGSNSGERIHQAATELTEVAPDVIVSTTSTTTRALMNATGNIPIVARRKRRSYRPWFYEEPVPSDRKHNGLHDIQRHSGCQAI